MQQVRYLRAFSGPLIVNEQGCGEEQPSVLSQQPSKNLLQAFATQYQIQKLNGLTEHARFDLQEYTTGLNLR